MPKVNRRKYSEGGIYRFLWLRAFGPPVVFVLGRSGDQITLTTKVLDQQPEFLESKYDPRGWSGLMEQLKDKTIERFGDSLIVVKADRKATIVSNQTKRLPTLEWTNFEQLLAQAGFSTRPAIDSDRGNDGSEWIIESLQKNKYRCVVRWSPEDAFREAGVYLIKLSGFKGRDLLRPRQIHPTLLLLTAVFFPFPLIGAAGWVRWL